jgi:hypothetical protein
LPNEMLAPNGHVDECWWEPFASVCEASAIAWRTEHE